MEGKEFWGNVEKCVEKTLWEQLELLAERSQDASYGDLSSITNAMVDIARVLIGDHRH